MQWSHVEKKEEPGDRGAFGGADIDGDKGPWGPLEDKGAASFAEEGRNSGDQIGGYPAFPQDAGKS